MILESRLKSRLHSLPSKGAFLFEVRVYLGLRVETVERQLKNLQRLIHVYRAE